MITETHKKNYTNVQSVLVIIAFAGYLWLLCDILFFSRVGAYPFREVNLVPFASIGAYATGGGGVAVNNILGNILLFLPLGLYLPYLLKDDRLLKNITIIIAASAIAEIVQYAFMLGASDVDDLMLNTLGGFAGIMVYRLIERLAKSRRRTQTVMAAVSACAGLPIIAINVLLHIANA